MQSIRESIEAERKAAAQVWLICNRLDCLIDDAKAIEESISLFGRTVYDEDVSNLIENKDATLC